MWIVLVHPTISNSSSPLFNLLRTVPRTPITISITIPLRFRSFLSSQARSKYLSPFSLFLISTLQSAGKTKSTIRQILFLVLIISEFCFLAGIRFSVCISKSQRILYVSISRTYSGLCTWSNFILLLHSQWITFPNQLCPVLYVFVLVSYIRLFIWLIVPSLSSHYYYYLHKSENFLCFYWSRKDLHFVLSFSFLSIVSRVSFVFYLIS